MFRFASIVLIVLTLPSVLEAQSSETRGWQGFIGKNGEFAFLIPAGFQVSDDGEIYIGTRNNSVRAKNSRVFSCYVNSSVLMLEFFQGKAAEIQSKFAEMMRMEVVKEETLNGFEIRSYRKAYPEYIREEQHFFSKESLYVMSAVYRSERTPIIDNFFKSARLINQGQIVAPNLPKDTKKNVLTAALPNIKVEISDSEQIEEAPDKKAVIVYRPKPNFKRAFGKSNSGKVFMNALLSASGKVKKAELISAPNINLADGVRPSVEHIVFLPAEKNGKRVTSWYKVEYEFEIFLRSF